MTQDHHSLHDKSIRQQGNYENLWRDLVIRCVDFINVEILSSSFTVKSSFRLSRDVRSSNRRCNKGRRKTRRIELRERMRRPWTHDPTDHGFSIEKEQDERGARTKSTRVPRKTAEEEKRPRNSNFRRTLRFEASRPSERS